MEITNAEDMLVNTTINDRICYVEMQNAEHFNCLSEAM
jgi:methylmalonyl-CoA decarboxylase